eukprot:8171912-Pyramimonas_sp.AAC.1
MSVYHRWGSRRLTFHQSCHPRGLAVPPVSTTGRCIIDGALADALSTRSCCAAVCCAPRHA